MQTKSIYPVICTKKLDESKKFYSEHFGFKTTFEADWYVSMQSVASPAYELAFLDFEHPSLPESFREPSRGLLINIEINDVDHAYEQLRSAGLPIVLELRSESWGQRHFITQDPNGLLIDIIKPIEPTDDYIKDYK